MTGLETVSNVAAVISNSTYPDEDDRRSNGEQSVELNKVLVLFFLAGAVHVELLNALNGQFLVLECDFVGVGSELARITVNVRREGGREQNNLDITGNHAFAG